jgi:hypothetical protein
VESARQDLSDLERRGLVQRRKVGRQLAFRPTPDLSRRLADEGNADAQAD